MLKGTNKSYDSLSSNIKFDNVSFSKLKSLFFNKIRLELNTLDLESFGLVENDMLTNAGALLCDEPIIYQSRVFATRWNGLSKSSGLIDALDDIEVNGSILIQLQEIESFIKRNIKKM